MFVLHAIAQFGKNLFLFFGLKAIHSCYIKSENETRAWLLKSFPKPFIVSYATKRLP